jgi:two-component system phosphate regulon sensor histidine kinase PhoR
MGRIASEAEKLAGIVEGMTNLARIESGEMRLKKQPVEIGAVINRAYQRLAEQITQKGLEYGFQSAENITVMVDEIQIEQVVYNLLDNAIKFTPRGGQLVVTVAMANRNLLVSVQDTGEGIDPDDINRIFERFYKADKARSSGGSGLGLAIARHIIEAHGGRIWAESQPGHGSLICFTLPL